MDVIQRFGLACVLLMLIGAAPAMAAPCSGNNWQPTFVHDLEKPDGPYYVMATGAFKKLAYSGNAYTADACRWIGSSGVRDQRGFTNCQDYTRIQCGCSRNDTSNFTCRNFLNTRP